MQNKIKEVFLFFRDSFFSIVKQMKFFFHKITYFWLLYLFSCTLFIGSITLSITGNNYTFDGKLENLSYQVARYAKNNEYETTIMNVSYTESNESNLVEEHRSYKYINGFITPQYYLNSCILGVNSKISNEFLLGTNNSSLSPKSVIFPNVFSSIEKNIINSDGINEKYYKMDDMNIYFKFKKPQISGYGINWCVISSEFAEKIADELNCDSLEDVIGKKVNVKYSAAGEEFNNIWNISGIYDSNLGDVPNLTNQYGDFVLSWLIYANYKDHLYYKLTGLSLSFNLHYSIKNNVNVIKRELESFNPIDNKYTFLTSSEYLVNDFLETSLLNTYSMENRGFFNTYNISSIILYTSLFFIIILTFFIDNKRINVGIEPFIFLTIILTLCFGIIQIITLRLQDINYNCSLVVYHCSQSLIIIYMLVLFYLLALKLISNNLSKNKKVITNDK